MRPKETLDLLLKWVEKIDGKKNYSGLGSWTFQNKDDLKGKGSIFVSLNYTGRSNTMITVYKDGERVKDIPAFVEKLDQKKLESILNS